MDIAENSARFLDANSDFPDSRAWIDSRHNRMYRLKKEHKDKMKEVEDFLREDFGFKRVKKFFDGNQFKYLNSYILELSPSLDYIWVDARGYTNRTYPQDEEIEEGHSCDVI